MPEYIDERVVKARKIYDCDYCHQNIEVGTKYSDFVGKNNGQIYHFKSHLRCRFIAAELTEYINPWDGMDEDEFATGCNNFCREFLCKDCNKFSIEYGNCGEDNFPCADCLDIIGDTLLKYDFVQEKTFPNKPVSKFWNPYKRYLKPKAKPLNKYPGEN